LRTFCRITAPACIVILAILSWLPADEMIRTGLDGRIEHFLAYSGTTIIVLTAYAPRLRHGSLAAMLVVYAGTLELGQHFSPGRHPSVVDFAASSLGVVAGAVLLELVLQPRHSSGER